MEDRTEDRKTEQERIMCKRTRKDRKYERGKDEEEVENQKEQNKTGKRKKAVRIKGGKRVESK